MFETLRNAWKVVDLRKKILFTLLIIVVFRIGSVIPVPFIDTHALHASTSAVNEFLNILSTLGGGALTYGTIFALGVTPYINSSIIMQLLGGAKAIRVVRNSLFIQNFIQKRLGFFAVIDFIVAN